MDAVLRAVALYAFLVVVFRISGKRSLGQVTTFDFVLLFIVAETTEYALLRDDLSMTQCFVLIATLVSLDGGLSVLKQVSPRVSRLLEGVPLVVVEHGRPVQAHMRTSGVDEDDVLEAARKLRGLERMDQIAYAVLERNGEITVIPRRAEAGGPAPS